MARLITNQNPYSQTISDKFYRRAFVIVFGMAGMALAYAISQNTNLFTAVVGYFVLAMCLVSCYKIYKQIGKNDRGASAESKVKTILLELPDSYTIFQNVLIKSNLDIDFVVVGPGAIFAIEVKSHPGVSFFGGQKFINQTFAEAMLLKEYLQASGVKVFVRPVLVYTRAQVKNRAPQGGVCITSSDWLLAHISQVRILGFDRVKTEVLIQQLYNT